MESTINTSNLAYTFVTSLDEADAALTSDVFLISQLSSNSHYLSKKLPYSKLCSLILIDVDTKIDDRLNDVIGELSSKVDINIEDIRFLSNSVDNCVTAIVKIANCVQVNKGDIKYLSSMISSTNFTQSLQCENGISSRTAGSKYYIGHTNKLTSGQAQGLYKVGYDRFGHISSTTNVTKSDITKLGIPSSDTTYSKATTEKLGLIKLKATDFSVADRFRLSLDIDGNAFVDVPLEEKIDDVFQPADEDKPGVVALCADLQTAAAAIPGFASTSNQMYPLKMFANKYAYVEVPPPTIEGLGVGTKNAPDDTYAITSISYAGGNIVDIGTSQNLNDRISQNETLLEYKCLLDNNTRLRVNVVDGIKKLQLIRDGDAISEIDAAQFNIGIDDIDVKTAFVKEYADEIQHTTPAISTYCGLYGSGNTSYSDIPYEDWTFTLDDGSTITKRVITYGIS